jgi:hypothetical protein
MAPRAGSWSKHLGSCQRRKNGISIASPSCGVIAPANRCIYHTHRR